MIVANGFITKSKLGFFTPIILLCFICTITSVMAIPQVAAQRMPMVNATSSGSTNSALPENSRGNSNSALNSVPIIPATNSQSNNTMNIQIEVPTSPPPSNKAADLVQNNNQTAGRTCNGACMLNTNKEGSVNTTGVSPVVGQPTITTTTLPPQYASTPLPQRVRKMPDGSGN